MPSQDYETQIQEILEDQDLYPEADLDPSLPDAAAFRQPSLEDFLESWDPQEELTYTEVRLLAEVHQAMAEKLDLNTMDLGADYPRDAAESLAEYACGQIKSRFDAAYPPPDLPELFDNTRWLAAYNMTQSLNFGEDPAQYGADPPSWLTMARAQVCSWLLQPEPAAPAAAMLATVSRAMNYGQDKLFLRFSPEDAVEHKEPSPRLPALMAEFQEKLEAFMNDPEAVLTRRHQNDYRTETFAAAAGRPETRLLQALEIANNQLEFATGDERAEFAEFAAGTLLDQVLGGSAERRYKETGSEYAAAEGQFKELLTEQLASWQLQTPDYLPQHFQHILSRLQKTLEEGISDSKEGDLYEGIACHRLALSRYQLPDPHMRYVALAAPPENFTMARYSDLPRHEYQYETYAHDQQLWDEADVRLTRELLRALTESYPNTAFHKEELKNWRPEEALGDLKAVFHNQQFRSREHCAAAAAALAAAVSPTADPLLAEGYTREVQSAQQGAAALVEFLLDPSNMHNEDHHQEIRKGLAPAWAAQQEAETRREGPAAGP